MRIVVERKKWNTNFMDTKLFDGEKYCIMGFVGKALGIPDKDMKGKIFLNAFSHLYPLSSLDKVVWYNKRRYTVETLLMYINDEVKQNKEYLLKKEFKKLGHTLIFK